MGNLDLLTIFLAALAFFAVGAVWYGALFGKAWRQLVGITDVGALIAENQALRRQNQALLQQNQQLEASVRIWAEDYQLLKDWGEAIHTRLRQLRGDLPS